MRRLVKVTRKDGSISYKVEVFRKKTFKRSGIWETERFFLDNGVGVEAIFNNKDDALRFMNVDPNPVIKEEVVYEQQPTNNEGIG